VNKEDPCLDEIAKKENQEKVIVECEKLEEECYK